MERPAHQRRLATAAGLLAILIWSTSIALARSLAESVGALTSASSMLLIGGAIGCLYVGLVQRRLGAMLRLPRAYLVGCGLLFVAYMACLYLAIGLARSRQQTIEVGILNYLWPGLTLLFAVPLLGTKVRAAFLPGVILVLAGGALAPLRWGEYSPAALAENLRANPLPYVLAVAAAVLWALYSALSRRWGAGAEGGAVPLFTLAAGLVLGALRPAFAESAVWTWRAAAELAFMAVVTVMVAYAFWDVAMRRGNVTLVAAAANLTPLLSTAVSGLYLGVAVGWNLWLACGLVVAGAIVCERSVIRTPAGATPM